MDPVIRPANSAILLKLQTADDVPATPSPSADAVPFEIDSMSYTGPFRNEASNEASGSLVGAAPLVVGQPATVRFRGRIKGAGAGATYSASVKPPYHQAMAACGWRGLFTAAVSAAALAAGTTTTATLGTGFAATAQVYRGMPVIMTGGVGAGAIPLIADYTASKVAMLTDVFGSALSATTSAAIPDNWTYAGTSPRDGTARATDHPSATIYLYEDGTLHQFINCRGVMTLDGQVSRPGYASFEFTGTYVGTGSDAAVPTSLVIANHSAPILVQGSGVSAAFLVNRKGLPISQWALAETGTLESPEDPNTTYGFGAGQIGQRAPMFTCDPLATLIATRNTLSEIGNFAVQTAALRYLGAVGNRWSMMIAQAQPVGQEPGSRGTLRSHNLSYRALPVGRDPSDRDNEIVLSFF